MDFQAGSRELRELLGGKGAGIAEMTRVLGAERVPAGFTVTTDACVAYMREGALPDGLEDEVLAALGRLESQAGRRLGDVADPLLVSVRSGARESMPGMLDTVLNLGLNDLTVAGLASGTGNERFAWDSYRRFVQMYGNVVIGVPGERFEQAIAAAKARRGVALDTDLDAGALRELTEEFKGFYEFPSDPLEQLMRAIRAVFDSWQGERAVAYRRINRIPDEWGTAVNVQQMVFGNLGESSGSGVAFSGDERPPQAAVRFAGDAVEEGLLDRETAIATIDSSTLDALLHPTFDPGAEYSVVATGVAASPGAAKGEIVLSAAEAVRVAAEGRDVILVRSFTEADDVAGFHAARGILTSEGGKASHAALVARGMGRPAVTGANEV